MEGRSAPRDGGTIVTFYSYKGGTGRSMALANVAWVLASNGRRVLVIDWDLDAPGLHRFFAPFLLDPTLAETEGLIDFIVNFANEAATPRKADPDCDGQPAWFEPLANILPYAVSLAYPFLRPGTIDFVPAGRQGPGYAHRVGALDWDNFYERMGGGVFLEAAKRQMRASYDYILIDSRTGVSDTAGISTVQMPDILVACFTANNQSIEGTAAVAESVRAQWEAVPDRAGTARQIYPVLSRVDPFEKDKLERRREYAHVLFDPFLDHLTVTERADYWRAVEIPYIPFYAYEEILATFGDNYRQETGLLAAMERLTASLTGKEVRQFEQPPTEKERRDVLRRYAWLGSAKTKEIPDESGKDEKREVKVTYDVFLLYSGPDRPAVEQLARRLKLARIELFLDKWNLIPGDFWQEAIEEALLKSAACTVFIGPGDFSPWQHEELRAAIEHRVSGSRGGYRVIPVLLPGASRPGEDGLPRFLQGTTWVQFSRTLDDEEAFHNLVSGIRGLPPGMGRGKGIFEGKCPYRGLAPFGPEHTPFFFGREAQTDWLLGNRLAPMVRSGHVQRFLAILGPSGSGKSSLALAGLVPALRAGKIEGSAAWPIAILRPGDDPFENLTSELSKLKDMADTGEALLARTCEYLQVRDFADDPRALHIFARHALDGAPATRRLVVLVDQFEEVFTQYPAERKPTRRAFIDTLLHAATVVGGPALVLLTMRTDFLGECVSYPALAAALADGQELVGPMSEEELRQAIERPAYLVGCEPELGLAERLLRDVEGRPGALPLLQYTLWELWRRRDGRRLTIAAYREIGGVQGALERRADEVVDNLNDAEREVCRRIFLRLTQPGEGIEDFKRRASFGELVPAGADPMVVEAVIHRLADARLITTEGALKTGGEVSVEVAHEALIRSWGRLREWIDADRAGLRLHRQLAEAAREWKEHAGDASFLFQGTRLAAAREWNEEHRPELNPPELEFLTASLEAERKKADEAEQRVQEARRKQRQQMIVLMGIAVVLLLLAEVAAILVPPTLANRLVEGRLKDLASYAQVVASTVFEELKRLSEPVLEATRARELQKLLKGDDVQRMVEYVKEKVESEQIKYKNFDLRLMSSLNGVSGIPTKGKNLIIVAAVNDVLHFRIFDGDGKVVVDTDEKGLTEQARQIEDLRKQLESLWLPHELTRSDKDRVITAVTQVITAVTQYRPSEDRDLQKMLESEDLRGLQRYTEEYLTKINRGTGKYESIYIEKGGIILAVSPKNQDIIGKDYSERKYYIEAMMRSDKKGMNSVYISPVFRAENDDLFKFAISAPVPDSERPGPPLGVVAVTIASNSALGSNQLRVDLPGISANAGENGPRPVRRPRNPGMLAPKNGRALRVSGDENSKLTAVLVGRWDQSLPRGSARDSQQPKPKPKYLIVIHPAYQHRDNPFEVDLQGFQGFDTKQATNRNYEDPLKNRDEEYAGRMLAASAPVESTELFVIAQQHYNEAIKQSEILAKYLILGGIFLFLGTIIIGAAVVYGGLVGNGTSSPKRLNN